MVGRFYGPKLDGYISNYVKKPDDYLNSLFEIGARKQAEFDKMKNTLDNTGVSFKFINESDPLYAKFDQSKVALQTMKLYQDRLLGFKNNFLETGDTGKAAKELIDFNNAFKQDKNVLNMNASYDEYLKYKKEIADMGSKYGIWNDRYLTDNAFQGTNGNDANLFTFSRLNEAYDQRKTMNDFIGKFAENAYKQGKITLGDTGEWKVTQGNEGYVSEGRVRKYIKDNISQYLSEDYGRDYVARFKYAMKDNEEFKKLNAEQQAEVIKKNLENDLFKVAEPQIHSKPTGVEDFTPYPKGYGFGNGSSSNIESLGISTYAGSAITQYDSYDKVNTTLSGLQSSLNNESANLKSILRNAATLGKQSGIVEFNNAKTDQQIYNVLSKHLNNPKLKAYYDQYSAQRNKYYDIEQERNNLLNQTRGIAEFSIVDAASDINNDFFKNRAEREISQIYIKNKNNPAALKAALIDFYNNGKNRYRNADDLSDYQAVINRINKFGHEKALNVAKKDMSQMTENEKELYRNSSIYEISNSDPKTLMGKFTKDMNMTLGLQNAQGINTGGGLLDLEENPDLEERLKQMTNSTTFKNLKIIKVAPSYGTRTNKNMLSATFSYTDSENKTRNVKIPDLDINMLVTGYDDLLNNYEKMQFEGSESNKLANRLISNRRIGTNLDKELNNYETQLRGNYKIIRDTVSNEDIVVVGSSGEGNNSSSMTLRAFKVGDKQIKNKETLEKLIKNKELEEITYGPNGENIPIMDVQTLGIAYGDYIRRNAINDAKKRSKLRQ